jgi:glutathione S-transferase
MGSKNIAKYLEKAFPEAPRLYPGASEALASMIEEHLNTVRHFALYRLVYHKILASLDEAGEDYYRRTRTEMLGPGINESPSAEEEKQIWKQVPERTAYLGQLLQENDGPFLQGYDRSYADLILVASLRARHQWDPSILQRILDIEPAFARLYKACNDILEEGDQIP